MQPASSQHANTMFGLDPLPVKQPKLYMETMILQMSVSQL